jgi:hypothetical protein
MTFFLDENFPRPALALLEGTGHKASHAFQDTVWLVTDNRIRSRHI